MMLTCNAGSSTIKLALFEADGHTCRERITLEAGAPVDDWLHTHTRQAHAPVLAVGHRVVHGGREFHAPAVLTPEVIQALEALVPLAPLHQPPALTLIRRMQALFPDVPHLACFDTAFHRQQPMLEQRLPLPRAYHDAGMQRYGFHGLSYEYIASILPHHAGEAAHGRVIVAHLGNGSSMCALRGGQSVASTMGFSTLEGLMMGTRCGSLDAGVLLHLLQQRGMSAADVQDLLYLQSGLKGVSGGHSGDMRTLLTSADPAAREAVALYCYLAAKQLGGLLMALGGVDALVFTAGIGQHAAPVRAGICHYLRWLGVTLDPARNAAHATVISADSASAVPVYVLPTDEEAIMARACAQRVAGGA